MSGLTGISGLSDLGTVAEPVAGSASRGISGFSFMSDLPPGFNRGTSIDSVGRGLHAIKRAEQEAAFSSRNDSGAKAALLVDATRAVNSSGRTGLTPRANSQGRRLPPGKRHAPPGAPDDACASLSTSPPTPVGPSNPKRQRGLEGVKARATVEAATASALVLPAAAPSRTSAPVARHPLPEASAAAAVAAAAAKLVRHTVTTPGRGHDGPPGTLASPSPTYPGDEARLARLASAKSNGNYDSYLNKSFVDRSVPLQQILVGNDANQGLYTALQRTAKRGLTDDYLLSRAQGVPKWVLFFRAIIYRLLRLVPRTDKAHSEFQGRVYRERMQRPDMTNADRVEFLKASVERMVSVVRPGETLVLPAGFTENIRPDATVENCHMVVCSGCNAVHTWRTCRKCYQAARRQAATSEGGKRRRIGAGAGRRSDPAAALAARGPPEQPSGARAPVSQAFVNVGPAQRASNSPARTAAAAVSTAPQIDNSASGRAHRAEHDAAQALLGVSQGAGSRGEEGSA